MPANVQRKGKEWRPFYDRTNYKGRFCQKFARCFGVFWAVFFFFLLVFFFLIFNPLWLSTLRLRCIQCSCISVPERAEGRDRKQVEVGWTVSSLLTWCIKTSQPQMIISGLRENFINRHVVQRTSKTEHDQKNRVRKRRVVESWKGHKNRTKNRIS